MAGTYFEILRPGYSVLTTHDVPYTNGTGETGVNVFSPLSTRPLIEGEWLEYAAGSAWAAKRGGSNAGTAVPGTPDSLATGPSFPHWLEKGRFDAQTRQYAHLLKGPGGFTFRTRVCDTAFQDGSGSDLGVGDLVAVYDVDLGDGVMRRGLAKKDVGAGPAWVVGTVERVYGTNDIAVNFNPFYLA